MTLRVLLRAVLPLLLATVTVGWAQLLPEDELRGVDALEDEAARRRSGVAARDLPVGTGCTAPGAELEIAGIGRAVYDRIAVDTARGRATLSGGVCIEVPEVDLVLRALYFDVRNLEGEVAPGPPTIAALEAVLDVGGWRLMVAALQGPIDGLALQGIRLLAPGLEGVAEAGSFDGTGDRFEASLDAVSLAAGNYLLNAETARLFGDTLLLRNASGTTCVCPVERYRLSGARVRADLRTGRVTVQDPLLHVLGVRVSLGPELTVGEDGARFEPPFAFEERDGLGGVAVLRGEAEEGLHVELGAATKPLLAPMALLSYEEQGDRLRVETDGRGLLLEARRQRPLVGDVWIAAISETLLRGDDPRLRAGAEAGWSGRREDDLGGGTTAVSTVSARAGVEVAAEPGALLPPMAAPPADPGVAAVRLPFAAELRTVASPTPGTRLDLRARAAGAAYPLDPHPGRIALTLAPSWTLQGDDARLTLGAERRWVAGDGPFAFDASAPRFRVTADGRATLGPVEGSARLSWRLPPERPGAEDLRLRAHADLPLAGGWTLRPAVRGELAGLFGGPAREDWVEAELAVQRGEDLRVGLRAREGLDPAEFRDLVLGVQVPIDLQDVRLVPYLAVDAAPMFEGGGPELAGHGLRLYVNDCCGTVILGYRMEGDRLRVELDIRLPPLELGDVPLGAGELPEGVAPVPEGPPRRGPGGPVPLPEQEPEQEPGGEPEAGGAAAARYGDAS